MLPKSRFYLHYNGKLYQQHDQNHEGSPKNESVAAKALEGPTKTTQTKNTLPKPWRINKIQSFGANMPEGPKNGVLSCQAPQCPETILFCVLFGTQRFGSNQPFLQDLAPKCSQNPGMSPKQKFGAVEKQQQ